MATYRAELTTKDEVLSYYDNIEDAQNFGFRVFAGSKVDDAYLRYEFEGQDKSEGGQILANALDAILSNPNNTNLYLLQVIRAKIHGGGQKGRKTRYDGQNITFQLNGVNSGAMGQMLPAFPQKTFDYFKDELERYKIENESLREQIAELEAECEEKQETKQSGIGAMVSTLFERPEIQQALISGVTDFFKGLKKNNQMTTDNNNIQNDVEVTAAVNRLKSHVPDLAALLNKLSTIAENDKAQFDMLCNILRQN
jgi:hypothetical protein